MFGFGPRRKWLRILPILLLMIAGATMLQSQVTPGTSAAAVAQQAVAPRVDRATQFDVSQPLRDMTPKQVQPSREPASERGEGLDPKLERSFAGKLANLGNASGPSGPSAVAPNPLLNFDGVFNTGVFRPPDTTGEVGRTQYLQQTNGGFGVFSKATGAMLYGPAGLSTVFTGFGGVCETADNGDPITLYDQIADRWVLSQFAFPKSGTVECFAISTSGDALGTYYRYAYNLSPTLFEDFPKLGIWPTENAIAMTVNSFANGGSFLFAGAYAFNRDAMLRGVPDPVYIYFPIVGDGSAIPGDVEGYTLPPAGERIPILTIYDSTATDGTLALYRFHPRFDKPSASTFTTTPQFIRVNPFDFDICPASRSTCIPQPGTTTRLEAINLRPMNKMVYRNFGDHEALLVVQTVDGTNAPAGAFGVAAEQWYEIRGIGTAATTTVFQEGSSPNRGVDNVSRWMGSINFDNAGNIALGYSASSDTVIPSIRYAVRATTDVTGTLGSEINAYSGTGVETGTTAGRWGDYSHMSLDPVDDCTFWYTQEYYGVSSISGWRTRIVNFKMPNCSAVQTTPTATPATPLPTSFPTVTATGTPLACVGVSNVVTGSITTSDPTAPNQGFSSGPSTCGDPEPKTYPGNLNRGDPHYDIYTFTNSTPYTQCYTLRLFNQCGTGQAIQSSIYITSFNPISPTMNFWADSGSRLSQQPESYSFSIPGNTNFVVKVNGFEGPFLCDQYRLEISACSLVTATPTPLPTATPCTIKFADVPATGSASTFYPFVQCLACRGIIGGYKCGGTNPQSGQSEPCNATSDPYYRPSNNVTRGELSKIVALAARLTYAVPTGQQSFHDVVAGDPFYVYIEQLAQTGAISGYTCNTTDPMDGQLLTCDAANRPWFKPNNLATRGQISKIVAIAAEFNDDIPGTRQTFTDVPKDSPFWVYIERLSERQIIGGYNDAAHCGSGTPCFRYNDNTSRGQMAKIAANAFFPLCQTPTKP